MKLFLIFRYHYSVVEVWGPYFQGELMEALDKIRDEHVGQPLYDARYFAVKEIDHFHGNWSAG